MQNVVKKVYISILTCVIVMITMVATTFAWVGILTTTSVGGFELGVQSSVLGDDFELQISTDGVNFSKEVSLTSIKQQILRNMGIDYEHTLSNPNDANTISQYFNRVAIMDPVSSGIENNQFTGFYSIMKNERNVYEVKPSNKYFKYDIYLSISSKNPIQDDTEISASIFLANLEEAIKGVKCTGSSLNGNPFANVLSNFKYPILKDIPDRFTIDSSSSARFALSIYNPIKIDNIYTNETPIKTIVYQGGTNEPSLKDGIYSLGGILPEEYNYALRDLNSANNTNFGNADFPIGRENDYELTSGMNNLWTRPVKSDTSNINFLGIQSGVVTKMKISVYFWFEGWDADCLNFISHKDATLNLTFMADLQ